MNIEDLIFVGLNKHVIALSRATGEMVWTNSDLNRGYSSLLLDGDQLIVSANGYIYCLDPLTGNIRWQNPLTGYGLGAASLASVRGKSAEDAIRYAAEEDAERSRRSASH